MASRDAVHVSRLLVLGVVITVVFSGVVSAGVTPPVTEGGTPIDDSDWSLQAPSEDPIFAAENNSSIDHEDPENVSTSGDIDAVKQWLSGSMTGQLSGSTTQISQGQYDQARKMIGDEYDSYLEAYIDVAGETESTTDDSAADSFRTAQQEQQELASTVETYNETYEEYQEAKEAGETERARQLARQLNNLSSQVHGTAQTLTHANTNLENTTGIADPLDIEITKDIDRNIANQTATITEAEFESTTLRLESTSATGSFADPINIQGQLTTDNGSPIANQTVHIAVGERRYTPSTTDTGNVSLSYRPLFYTPGNHTLTVRYLPDSGSPYFGSNATLNVNIQPANATLTAAPTQDTTAYGKRVAIRGNLTANQTGVPRIPLTLQMAGQRIGEVQTNESGMYLARYSIPADISPGSHSISVNISDQPVAVTAQSAISTIEIRETGTTLSLNTTESSDALTVSGQLLTNDGQPVSNQQLQIRINGTLTTTTSTDNQGEYSTSLSRETLNSSTVAISSEFDGADTNLRSATATDQVMLESQSETGPEPNQTQLLPWLIAGLIGLGVIGLGVLAYQRRQSPSETTSVSKSTRATTVQTDSPSPTILDELEEVLTTQDTKQGIQDGYWLLRTQLADAIGIGNHGNLTHREFETSVTERLPAATDTMATITRAFERAKFSHASLDTDPSETFLNAARQVLDEAASPPSRANGRGHTREQGPPGSQHSDSSKRPAEESNQ